MNERTAQGRQFTGWHMVGVMVAFFGVVIAVNITMAVFAATSWTGLITKDSYLAGQSYNEDLAEARRQAALRYDATFGVKAGAVEFTLLDADGKPVLADRVVVSLGRPADNVDDHDLTLEYVGLGLYRAPDALAPGQWQADLTATFPDGSDWRRIWRIQMKQGETR